MNKQEEQLTLFCEEDFGRPEPNEVVQKEPREIPHLVEEDPAEAMPGVEEGLKVSPFPEETLGSADELPSGKGSAVREEKAENKRDLPSVYSGRILKELLLYSGSGSAHKIRARLRWKGTREPYVEQYCDSEKEAIRWAGGDGEDELIQKLMPKNLKNLGRGMLFRMAVKVLPDEDGAGFKRYFEEHPALLKALSRKPIEQMNAEVFGSVINKELADENPEGARVKAEDIQKAVGAVNTVLRLCQTYGILHSRIQVRYNNRKADKFLKAMSNALGRFVLPDEYCVAMYERIRSRMFRNAYYIGGLLALTMGLSLGEICALQYCDLCGLGDPWVDGDGWTIPESDVWVLKIRRFYRRKRFDGHESQVLTMAATPYQYRLLVVPPHTQEVLKDYIRNKGEAVTGSAFLIPAHRGGGGVKPDGMRDFLQKLLMECGIKEALEREVFLPAKDDVGLNQWKKLTPNVSVFRHTLRQKLETRCEFEPHEVRSYLGLPPYATIDEHYWEAKEPLALQRMYGKLYSWDLRRCSWDQVPVPEHQEGSGKEVHLEMKAPLGYTADAFVTLRGQPGEQILMELMAKYGFSCRYTVTHSEQRPQTR